MTKRKKPTKKRMGRPPIELDQRAFEGLCGLQCTECEMMQFFNVTKSGLERWCKRTYDKTFATIFKEKRANGLISLRRSGFRLAEKNAAVWIFMAKNFLGMTDNPISENGPEEARPVSVTIQVQDFSKPKEENETK